MVAFLRTLAHIPSANIADRIENSGPLHDESHAALRFCLLRG
jgi:hypothetical protein